MNAQEIRKHVAIIEELAHSLKRETFHAYLGNLRDEELRSLRDEVDELWEAANKARCFTMSEEELRQAVEVRAAVDRVKGL